MPIVLDPPSAPETTTAVPLTEGYLDSTSPATFARDKDVFIYERGTETEVQLFADEGLSVPVSQPLITDKGGRPHDGTGAIVWLAPVACDIVLDGQRQPWNPPGFVDLSGYQATAQRGVANGYASLEAAGKVPASQLAADLAAIADLKPKEGDLLLYDGSSWVRLPVGGPGEQAVVGSDGTIRYIKSPQILADAWGAKADDATDNTAALEAAFKRAEEIGAEVRFSVGKYQAQAGKLGIYSGGVAISGPGRNGATLKAKAGSEGWLLTLGRKAGTRAQQENHSDGNAICNLQLDGNGRGPDAGGLNCEAQQFCTIDNVFAAHFKRQAARFKAFRESVVHNLYCRTSGTAYQYPQVHFDDSAGGQECCNNVTVIGLRSVGHAGHGLAIEGRSDGGANGPLRNISFYGAMLHGAAFPFPYEVAEGYTYSNESEFRQSVHNLLVKDARNIAFHSPRFNAAGRGAAAVRIAKGIAGASTVNGLTLHKPSYGTPNEYAKEIAVTATVATDILKAAVPLWLGTGAVVQVASTGTLPGGLSASTEYWVVRVSDTEVKLATNREKAEAGEAIDLTTAGTGTVSLTPRWINIDHEYGTAGSLQIDRGEITPSTETGATVVNRTGNNEAIGSEAMGLQKAVVLTSERRANVVQVEGEAQPRWYIDGAGAMWWGTGSEVPKRLVYSPSDGVLRLGASTLTIDGAINANGSVLNILEQLAHKGLKAGFFNKAPVTRPNVKAPAEVTAKELCEALEALGLIE